MPKVDLVVESSGKEEAVDVSGIDTFSLVSVVHVDLVVIHNRSRN